MDEAGRARILSDSPKMRFLDKLKVGVAEAGDCGQPSDEKPTWLDKDKLYRIREIFEEHCPGILLGHFLGQSILAQVPSLAGVMLHTGNHSTLELAKKRAVMTVGYVLGWYKGRVWDPNDPAHKSVQNVRAMHHAALKKTTTEHPKNAEEGPWISQYDMTLTQFAFLGPLILFGQKLGLYCSQEELNCLVHFWRYIGYLLGIKDEYNLGGLPFEELVEVCHDIVREVSIPTYTCPIAEFTAIGKIGTEGYSYLNRTLDYDAMHNFACELLGLEDWTRRLEWKGYFSSWFLWLVPKLLRFPFLRQLTTPSYRRALEHRISSYLKDQKSLPYIDKIEDSKKLSFYQTVSTST